MRRALIFGASGQLGRPLLARLRAAGWQVLAVSRDAHGDGDGLRWLRGDCDGVPGLPDAVDAILSCGPLDAFARWYATAPVASPRVVAFGSTSVSVKQASADPAERDLASRLRAGESGVLAAASRQGAAATLLRPTLVYGAGRDRTLTRIAAFARRSGVFALPRDATGLRQPVHVDDLADAAFAALDAVGSHGRVYELPGGETLAYRDMVARVLAALQPPARLLALPAPLFTGAVALLRAGGRLQGLGEAARARMREDLVFDAGPARRDLGYTPRDFRPTAAMFDPAGSL
jgi:nucleoside-diphosphate-sugar epimerase